MHRAGIYEKFIKRGLDLLLSGCALLVLWPVLLVLVLLVRSKLGSPAIFCQERPGKNGKVFRLYKLRTMTDERDENGQLLPDEQASPPSVARCAPCRWMSCRSCGTFSGAICLWWAPARCW